MGIEITLPHRFEPRPYQMPFLKAMDSGFLRAVQVWHRKSGKEKTDWNFIVKKTQQRVGNYWYVFPKLTQARKVVWDGVDENGVSFLDHIPKEALSGEPNATLMILRFKNGSTLQLIGGDSFDSTSVGGNPVGVVFSEYSLTDPNLWSFVRPILANNGGFAVFNFTPRGENHAYQLYELAKADPKNWFCQLLTVDDTHALSKEVLEQEQREIIRLNGNDAIFRQEYYCDFTVPISGAYYADNISQAYKEARIGHVPHDSRLQTHTWWDLGINDKMAIWFVQAVGQEVRIIDYYENSNLGLPHYIGKLKEKPYVYGRHVAPHDIEVRELTNGQSRKETAATLGINFEVAPRMPVQDGIDAVRGIFSRCWFDAEKCRDGLNALKSYRKQYDEKRKTYLNQPYHDFSSNGADAFRIGVLSYDALAAMPESFKARVEDGKGFGRATSEYDPYERSQREEVAA